MTVLVTTIAEREQISATIYSTFTPQRRPPLWYVQYSLNLHSRLFPPLFWQRPHSRMKAWRPWYKNRLCVWMHGFRPEAWLHLPWCFGSWQVAKCPHPAKPVWGQSAQWYCSNCPLQLQGSLHFLHISEIPVEHNVWESWSVGWNSTHQLEWNLGHHFGTLRNSKYDSSLFLNVLTVDLQCH